MPKTLEELEADLTKSQEEAKKSKEETAALKKSLEDFMEKSKAKPKEEEDKHKNEEDLLSKAKKEEEEKKKAAAGDKNLESALQFNLTVEDFVKNNKDILPEEFGKVLELSKKETYDSPKQKANAIRSGLIQSFFAVQAHIDMLTENQKKTLADFMKLTKNGKEETSHSVYENVFEPGFEMLKQIKKTEDRLKTKEREGVSNSNSYKEKLMKGSTEKYFGKKS